MVVASSMPLETMVEKPRRGSLVLSAPNAVPEWVMKKMPPEATGDAGG